MPRLHPLLVVCSLLIGFSSAASKSKAGKAKGCTDSEGKLFKVNEKYLERCDIFTCTKKGKKYTFKQTFNSTHCCTSEAKTTHLVGDVFNSTRLNFSCSVSQLNCTEVGNFTKPAEIVAMIHHGLCCAYRHTARNVTEHFDLLFNGTDEFYNGTMLDRHSNFTLYLEVNQTVVIPEKCLNLTCRQEDPWGLPVLAAEMVHRACNCCYYNTSMYADGERNITMPDGRNASCCSGRLVLPETEWLEMLNVTNATQPAHSSSVYNGSLAPVTSSSAPSPPDPALCHAACFNATDSYHNQFLTIIESLQAAQAANSSKGVAFVLDGSLHSSTSPFLYTYERNLAMLLALTLPINETNPMFVTKYSNYASCSWYDPAWCCQKDKCLAAAALSGPSPDPTKPSISTHQTVNGTAGFGLGQAPYLGLLWHGTALAHGAFNDTTKNTCASDTSNQLVVPIVNKEWHRALGGGGAFDENWPGASGRTVASLGLDLAPVGGLQEASSPGLAWKLGSTRDWHDSLAQLLACIDTGCCGGSVAAGGGPARELGAPVATRVVAVKGGEEQAAVPREDLGGLGGF